MARLPAVLQLTILALFGCATTKPGPSNAEPHEPPRREAHAGHAKPVAGESQDLLRRAWEALASVDFVALGTITHPEARRQVSGGSNDVQAFAGTLSNQFRPMLEAGLSLDRTGAHLLGECSSATEAAVVFADPTGQVRLASLSRGDSETLLLRSMPALIGATTGLHSLPEAELEASENSAWLAIATARPSMMVEPEKYVELLHPAGLADAAGPMRALLSSRVPSDKVPPPQADAEADARALLLTLYGSIADAYRQQGVTLQTTTVPLCVVPLKERVCFVHRQTMGGLGEGLHSVRVDCARKHSGQWLLDVEHEMRALAEKAPLMDDVINNGEANGSIGE